MNCSLLLYTWGNMKKATLNSRMIEKLKKSQTVAENNIYDCAAQYRCQTRDPKYHDTMVSWQGNETKQRT